MRDAIEKFRRQCAGWNELRVEQFRIDAGSYVFGAEGFAIVEDDSNGAAALHDHFAHAGVKFDLRAMLACRARHRLRDGAHAADGMSPDALLAIHLTERMMQHHISRTGGVRAGVIADDGIEAEQRLDQIVFKTLVQHFAGRARKEIEQAALLFERKLSQDARGAERVEGFADRAGAKSFDEVWRRAQHQLP